MLIGYASFLSIPITLNTWYHIALTKNGSNFYISVDGDTTLISYVDLPTNVSVLCVGGRGNSSPFEWFDNGSISSFRVSDTPKYTSNFTVPSLPLAADASTTLLLLGKPDNPFGDSSRYNRVASGTCTVVNEPIIL